MFAGSHLGLRVWLPRNAKSPYDEVPLRTSSAKSRYSVGRTGGVDLSPYRRNYLSSDEQSRSILSAHAGSSIRAELISLETGWYCRKSSGGGCRRSLSVRGSDVVGSSQLLI